MVNIIHRVGIRASISEVYRAIATIEGIAEWWTTDTSGISEINQAIQVRFSSHDGTILGSMEMEVTELTPSEKIQWRFLSGPSEWVDTMVTFELKQEDSFTIVQFVHSEWKEEVEFMAHCSTKWGVFLLSLKQFLECGTGTPAPNDIKIDNWN